MGLSSAAITSGEIASGRDALPSFFAEQRWYAAHTCANHEKRVAAELRCREVEHFLPLYSAARRWKDRRVTLERPLFPGYVFVRLALRDRLRVVTVPSVARLVGFDGWPTALPDCEIEGLRSGLNGRTGVQPHPFLTVGRRVRVVAGPFAGLEGILKRRKSGLRVVVSLQLIQQSVAVEVDEADLAAM